MTDDLARPILKEAFRPIKKDRGFTVIEVLVVAAVIVLLAAVLIPSLIAAKNRARSVLCVSNLRQISAGFTIYQQETGVFPYGFSDSEQGTAVPPPGGYAGTGSDRQGWWWFNFLQNTAEINLEPGSAAWCPSVKRTKGLDERNLLCGNYGVNRSVCKNAKGSTAGAFIGQPLRAGQVRAPAETMLIIDSGYALVSWLAAVDTGQPVYENPGRISSFYIPGLLLNQLRSELLDNTDAIQGRHPHQTLNISFADGHSDGRPAEAMKIETPESGEILLPAIWKP